VPRNSEPGVLAKSKFIGIIFTPKKTPHGQICSSVKSAKEWCRINSAYDSDVWTILDEAGKVVSSGVISTMYQ